MKTLGEFTRYLLRGNQRVAALDKALREWHRGFRFEDPDVIKSRWLGFTDEWEDKTLAWWRLMPSNDRTAAYQEAELFLEPRLDAFYGELERYAPADVVNQLRVQKVKYEVEPTGYRDGPDGGSSNSSNASKDAARTRFVMGLGAATLLAGTVAFFWNAPLPRNPFRSREDYGRLANLRFERDYARQKREYERQKRKDGGR